MDKGDSLDILSSLRPHIKSDILLKNIQSVRNGTIYSLETVTMAMPYLHFFNSRYRFTPFPTSIAYPFKQNGYSTAFVTGMDPTWENVLEGLTHQHFDTIIGKQELLHEVEGSSTSVIGVYDEYLYTYLLDRMKRNSHRPQFILALTTTNHPPFTYPEKMQLPPLTNSWYNSPMLTGNEEVLTKYGKGVQYANQSLGNFLEKFKKSPLAANTIIAVTGDHNVRTILDYSEGHVDVIHRHAVPLYIYLPEGMRPDSSDIARFENRHGSHFDLLPTLAPLALKSGTRYLNIGQNLFDPERNDSLYYSYNEKQLLAPEGCDKKQLMKMMQARELMMKIYYQLKFAKNNQ
jgi:phosphoglycerol transferase MdoB-like AlkP superfamily enzyme